MYILYDVACITWESHLFIYNVMLCSTMQRFESQYRVRLQELDAKGQEMSSTYSILLVCNMYMYSRHALQGTWL